MKKLVMAGKTTRRDEEVAIFVRLSAEEKARVEAAAAAEERSVSQFVRRTVLAAIEDVRPQE